MSGIKICNLWVERGGRPILNGLNLSLPKGQSLRITGPNGCGKSTLLKTIAGRIPPMNGQILFKDAPIHTSEVLFMDHHLLMKDPLTVAENISFWAKVNQTADPQLESAFEALDLRRLKHLPFSILSAGQKKRVQLSLLFLKKASIWLLDEPMLSLDEPSNLRLFQMIKNHLFHEGTLVYASHTPLPGLKDMTFDLLQHRDMHDVPVAA